MKFSHKTLYAISGAIWLVIGMMLLNLGLKFVMHGFQGPTFVADGYSSLFPTLASISGGNDNASIILIVFAILVGFIKGRTVLQKAAMRSFDRISKLSNPTSLSNLYNRANLLLIFVMMGLGMLMNLFQMSFDIRGFIDIAVGCGLMQGSVAYFHLLTRVTCDSGTPS
jgi:hypothetical protein